MDLKAYIRDVPDFPQSGVLFRDITPLLSDPQVFGQVLDTMAAPYRDTNVDAVAAIESRGFLFGAPLADRLRLPFVPIRKSGKLPAQVMSVEYALEYGTGQIEIHADAVQKGQRVLIVDDVLATGGTAGAAARLVELLGAEVAALIFLVELSALGGRDRLTDYSVQSLVTY